MTQLYIGVTNVNLSSRGARMAEFYFKIHALHRIAKPFIDMSPLAINVNLCGLLAFHRYVCFVYIINNVSTAQLLLLYTFDICGFVATDLFNIASRTSTRACSSLFIVKDSVCTWCNILWARSARRRKTSPAVKLSLFNPATALRCTYRSV